MPTTRLAASGRRRRVAVALLLILATPLAAAAVDDGGGPAGPDLPAVILPRFEPATPLETAGSGEAPAVDVRLTVNTEGRVARVEVLRIRPSGDHDDAFRAAVESALAEWRFAPAMQGGAPVEARFDWSLEFRPLEAGGGNHPWGFSGGASPGGGSASAGMAATAALTALLRDEQPQRARLLQIFTLPPAQQRRHLERLVALAEEPFAAEARKVADGRLFRVVTDHPGEDFAAAVAGNLDVTFAVLAELLHDSVPLQPPDF